jgi:thiamine kinase-like enzyme
VVSDEGLLAVFSKDLLIQHMVLYEEEDRQRARKSQFFDGTTHLRSSMIGNMIDLNDNGINGGSGVEGEREIRKNNMRRQETAMSRRISVQAYECKDLNELSVVCPVGKGTFGSVYLCKYKNKYGYGHGDDDYDDNDGRYIAVKCLDKHALVESKQHHYVRREVIALETFFHPFIASYYGTVVTSRKICLLLEYIPGGELWSYLYNILDEKDRSKHGGMVQHVAAIYASIVILALEHIHHLGYSYRDLKPENLLIDQDGYLKVVDFGFAKQIPYINNSNSVQYHTFTLCGTPDYMAP